MIYYYNNVFEKKLLKDPKCYYYMFIRIYIRVDHILEVFSIFPELIPAESLCPRIRKKIHFITLSIDAVRDLDTSGKKLGIFNTNRQNRHHIKN